MGPIDEIQEFLTKRDSYSYGVTLFSQISRNRRILHNLTRGETPYNWEKLLHELKEYVRSETQNNFRYVKETTKKAQSDTIRFESKRTEPRTKLEIHIESPKSREKKKLLAIPTPDRSNRLANNKSLLLNDVKQKQVTLYRTRGHLHGRLHEAPTDEIRKQLACDIMDIQSDIDSINKDLKLIESGDIPKELVLKMMTAKQYKSYRNYQNYIVRYKNSLLKEDKTPSQIESYQAKLKEYQEKIESFFNHG